MRRGAGARFARGGGLRGHAELLCAETESYSDWEVEEGKSIYGEDPEIASLAEWLVSLIHPPTN